MKNINKSKKNILLNFAATLKRNAINLQSQK